MLEGEESRCGPRLRRTQLLSECSLNCAFLYYIMGYLSPELTFRDLASVVGKDGRMLCVDVSSFNLLSKCQACPTLGLVPDIGIFSALWVFVKRLSRQQILGPKESITTELVILKRGEVMKDTSGPRELRPCPGIKKGFMDHRRA